MKPITADEVADVYRRAKGLHMEAFQARREALIAKEELNKEAGVVAKEAKSWGADPGAIQEAIRERTAEARRTAEAATEAANKAIADLEYIHYDLDSLRLIVLIQNRGG